MNPTIHASAVLVGPKAVLIRGPSGAGKSRLAWQLLQARLPFVRLVGDDRIHVEARNGRLLLRPPVELAGLIEIHGLGIRRVDHEPLAVATLAVDLAADAERLPATSETLLEGVKLLRLPVKSSVDALSLVLAFLGTVPGA